MSRFGRCCICTNSFTIADVTSLRCGHTFHTACIAQWLQNSKTCPNCRKKTTVRDLVKLYFDEADPSFSQSFLDTSVNADNTVEKLTSQFLAGKETIRNISEVNQKLRDQITTITKELKLAKKKLVACELKEERLKIVEQSLRDQQKLEATLKLWKARVKASEFYSYLLGKCPGSDEGLIDTFLNATKDDIEQKKFFDMLRGQRDKLEKQNQALTTELLLERNTYTKKKAEYKRKILDLQRCCDSLKAQCNNANRSAMEDDSMIDLNEYARKKSFGFSFTADDMDASDLMTALKTPKPKTKLRRLENMNEESTCEVVFDLLSKTSGKENTDEDSPTDVPIATSIADKKADAKKNSCFGKRFFSMSSGNFEKSNSILDKLSTANYLQTAPKAGSSKYTANDRIDRFFSDVKPVTFSSKPSLIILSAKEDKVPSTKNIEVIELDD